MSTGLDYIAGDLVRCVHPVNGLDQEYYGCQRVVKEPIGLIVYVVDIETDKYPPGCDHGFFAWRFEAAPDDL